MNLKASLPVIFFGISLLVNAQETETPGVKGKLSGQWRTYYMNTFNEGSLKDFYALATGGKIKYQLSLGKKIELGAAVYNATNLGIQDLTLPDATTGRISRYEEGLFDRLDLENDAIFLLGELYLKYKSKQHQISVGRMKMNTTLINPQDGRMIPTLVQGILYQYKKQNKGSFEIGILNEIAPRSTGRFYEIGESIGTYPVGRNIAGQQSEYVGNTYSDYVVVFRGNSKLTEKLQIHLENFYVDNISNSFYVKPKLNLRPKWELEFEWLHQNRLGEGGNSIDSLRYFTGNTSDIFGIRLGYQKNKSKISLAYNRILPQDQFLSPREWGREDLFSFQKRERSEGVADNHALVFYYNTSLSLVKDKAELRSIFSIGRHWKPSVLNAIQNKYAMPDYTHINLDIFFNFKNMKRLRPELLLVTKIANGDVPDNPNFFFNKTNLFHLDFILNYNF